jgi:hypothetical protein
MVLGISIDTRVDEAREQRRVKGYSFPSAVYTKDLERTLPRPKGVPVVWVRDRAGKLVMAEQGQLFPEDVEQTLAMLAVKSGSGRYATCE